MISRFDAQSSAETHHGGGRLWLGPVDRGARTPRPHFPAPSPESLKKRRIQKKVAFRKLPNADNNTVPYLGSSILIITDYQTGVINSVQCCL